MPTDAPTHAALLQVIETLNGTNAELRETIAAQRGELKRLVAMVDGLTKQIETLLEQKDAKRLEELKKLREQAAAAEELLTDGEPEGIDVPPPEPKPKPKGRDEHGRAPKPDDLERDTVALVSDQCDRCSSDELVVAETLVTEEYDYVRAHVRIRRTERTVSRCKKCDSRVTPLQPPMPFDRASCTFAMMAWLLFSRCGLFIPLDRLLSDFKRQGARIPSATATRWWKQGADLLEPIAEVVKLSLLTRTHIRTDGTGLRIIYPRRKAKVGEDADADGYIPKQDASNGQVIIFGDDEHAVYIFSPTKEGHHVLDFLTLGKDDNGDPVRWSGTITADAVSSHDILFVDDARVESGCNAHGLRKFRDDQDKAPLLASRAMAFIGKVYAVEAEARSRGVKGEALLKHRQDHAQPVVNQFKAWLDHHITDLLPQNPVRKAMQYYRNHWKALTRFLQDPRVPLDNNWSERGLRKVALFRKNSMFAGGKEGAKRLCTCLTLIQTCTLIGVDPYAYLEWALERVVPHPNNRRLKPEDLTPKAYKRAIG